MRTAALPSAVSDLADLYALIRRFEGCRLTPYICQAGVWTCGWGSTGADVFPGRPWTQEYADRRMEIDALRFAKRVLLACPRLSGARLCAVGDFDYNTGAIMGSTLRKRLNAEDWEAAKYELSRWVRGGGKVLPGLVLRRAAEAAML